MKTRILLPLYLAGALAAHAQLTIPGADGSDGALVITENTTIDLSQAVAGDGTTVKWDTDNTANAGQGIYDPGQWAVVFRYSSVSVAAGATLTFANHESRAPVVWLVSGDVTIEGAVRLNGSNQVSAPRLAEPGPGGFRGGTGDYSVGVGDGAGFGPGGGNRQARGGSYATGSLPYGNPSLIPLIGGSGGSGPDRGSTIGGAAGGGAILIACAQTATITGTISANGGNGVAYYFGDSTGGGAGGGIRLVCDTLDGAGSVLALAGSGGKNAAAGLGRIRVERITNTSSLQVTPDPSVVPLTGGSTALLWPPNDAPTVKIISIGGVTAPDDPRAAFGTEGADVALPEVATIAVVIETVGVEQASQVQVRLTPRATSSQVIVNAVVTEVDPIDPDKVTWTADIPVGNGYAAVQAKVVRP